MARFALGTFPGNPSSSPGSCRMCGVGRLRVGEGVPDETGVVVTEIWIDMEGVIILCESCARELGSLVSDPEKALLETALSEALDAYEAAVLRADVLERIVQSQREELSAMAPWKPPALATPEPELPFEPPAPKPAKAKK